jgi:hypothetical protein
MRMLSCFSAVCRPRKARPRRSARGLEKREIVRPEARPVELRRRGEVSLEGIEVKQRYAMCCGWMDRFGGR